MEYPYISVEQALEMVQGGKMLIIVDDEDRENEGDLYVPASFATAEAINFMAKYGRGLICLSLEEKWVEKLGLKMMTDSNNSKFHTNFTISIEASKGVTTGISAFDRSTTILAAINADVKPEDLVSPGHIFPLQAVEGGVLRRAGQTEASVDLSRMAGLHPSGVICEIMSEDGSMARSNELVDFAKQHQTPIVTIKSLIQYRLSKDCFVEQVSNARLPTRHGTFEVVGFRNRLNDEEYVALVKGSWEPDEPVMVRVHSECLTGDVFGSIRCDCQAQLVESLNMIEKEGKGVLLYLHQEGRGIGIMNKIKAYRLQDQGFDTVEANHKLGFKSDLRDYGFGAQVLRALKVRKIRLITNNPKKIIALKGYDLEVVERLPILIQPNNENTKYLHTKQEKMGHLLDHLA